jgi:hypothetical protein
VLQWTASNDGTDRIAYQTWRLQRKTEWADFQGVLEGSIPKRGVHGDAQ